jgi:hypothetical protein
MDGEKLAETADGTPPETPLIKPNPRLGNRHMQRNQQILPSREIVRTEGPKSR